MAARLYGQEPDRLKKRQGRENTSRRGKGFFLFTKSTQNNKLSNQGFPSLHVCVCVCLCAVTDVSKMTLNINLCTRGGEHMCVCVCVLI